MAKGKRRKGTNRFRVRRGWSLRLSYPLSFSRRKRLNSRGKRVHSRKRKGNRKRGRNVGRRFVYKFEKRRMFRLGLGKGEKNGKVY